MNGIISSKEAEELINAAKPAQVEQIFKKAAKIKQEIYGERLVLFAPLYVSDRCVNDCAYCNFRRNNTSFARRRLTMEEIVEETKCLIDMGHKRVLLEFGEDSANNNIDYVCSAIRAVYSVKSAKGNIRRVNVNIAATTVGDYRRLKQENIGTYQLFQETFHRPTYESLHKGPKADYDRQINAHWRAFEAGIDDLGIGVLFGLYDWRYEVRALIEYARKMESELGVGPHTISVPRWRQAASFSPAYPVSDHDFLKIIAILRIAVPYTGIILSTRETAHIRQKAFQLGVSQASAASVCVPGGYEGVRNEGQFTIQDSRSVNEVIKAIINDGLIPSFCTACYRRGRTGEKFMGLARPGDIHKFCRPNALLTFAEYLEDHADNEMRENGAKLIDRFLNEIKEDEIREQIKERMKEIKKGKRDSYF